MDWIFAQPVRIIFGRGRINELKALCAGYSCPVVIADRFFAKTGIAKDIARCAGAQLIFSEISPNPDVSEVDKCSALLRQSCF